MTTKTRKGSIGRLIYGAMLVVLLLFVSSLWKGWQSGEINDLNASARLVALAATVLPFLIEPSQFLRASNRHTKAAMLAWIIVLPIAFLAFAVTLYPEYAALVLRKVADLK